MGAVVARETFAPREGLSFEIGYYILVRPVVGSKNNQRVIAQSIGFERIDEAADERIHIVHHIDEVLLVASLVSTLAIRRGEKRIMNENHRVVGEKRRVGLGAGLYEIGEEVRADVWPVPISREVH